MNLSFSTSANPCAGLQKLLGRSLWRLELDLSGIKALKADSVRALTSAMGASWLTQLRIFLHGSYDACFEDFTGFYSVGFLMELAMSLPSTGTCGFAGIAAWLGNLRLRDL